ncbi:MAG: HAMP domain-containing protein [Candidatus Eisenbacteria bacterium]
MRFRARLPQIRWMQDTESLRGHPVESRVAQRVFSLFLVCSFAPVLALSTIVFLQVRSELKHQAESHLHGQSKGAGMAIADRLRVLDGQLASIEGSIERIGTLPPIGNLSAQDEPQSLAGIALLAGDGQVLQSEGRLGVIPPLDADDRAHLDGGRACLLSRARPDDRSVLYLFRKLESAAQAAAARTRPAEPGATPAGADRRVDVPVYLTARLDPDYLFSGEGFVSPPIELFALDKGGNLVFSSTGEIPEEELREAGYGTQSAGRFEWKNGDVDLFGAYWTLFMGYDFNTQWTLVHSEPRADVFAPLDRFRLVFILVMLLTFLVVISLSLMQIRRQLVPLHQLQTATRSLARGDLASRVSIRTNDEFAQLGSAFNQMATSIERSFDVIRSSNEIGISLTREKDVQRLLELVAEGAQHIVDADGAVIYIVTDEERLVPCVARVRSLALDRLSELEGVAGEEDRPLEASLAKVQDLHGSMIRRGDASDLPGKRLLQRLEQTHAYQVRDVLSIPLRDHDDEFIGVMQLINPRREGSEGGFSEEAVSAAESLASQCAVALTKSRLLDGFKGLFEGLTDLIATAIDRESPPAAIVSASRCSR